MSSEAETRPLQQLMVVAHVEVVRAQRLSPSYVRVELGGPAVADIGVDGPLYDQRIKLVFPPESGTLPDLDGADESWFATWLERPVEERGHMRTYTVRELTGPDDDRRLVVDFVVHGDPPDGVGAAWASRAAAGDWISVVAPRKGVDFGGIEFDPQHATELLLVGDETAVPAIAGIVSALPEDARGVVFLEVPEPEDLQLLPAPAGIDVRWLPRAGEPVGARVVPAVRRHLGLGDNPGEALTPLPADAEDVWETPEHSASGEDVSDAPPLSDHYAWIAGESTLVRTLRRTLVGELGWGRHQVAFMGYWRIGVSMRS